MLLLMMWFVLLLLLFVHVVLGRGRRSARVSDTGHRDKVHRASRVRPALRVVLCPCLHVLVGVCAGWVIDERRARHGALLLRLRLRLGMCLRLWRLRLLRLRVRLLLLRYHALRLCLYG